jgi:membrane protease YdiL (CAAX protease family)
MHACQVRDPAVILRDWLQRALWDVVPSDQREVSPPELRRRRRIALVVVVVGTLVLGFSLRIEPGSAWFYPATLGLALIWILWAFASGPLHLGRIAGTDRLMRPVASPILIGLGLGAVFIAGALMVRQVPFLRQQVEAVVQHADEGSLPLLLLVTVVNGVAEELFFRGALYAAIARHPVLLTTAGYGLATLATGNVMLVLAAIVLGAVVGLERRASGGVLAPALTHVTWSATMLFALPLLFA